MSSLQPEALTWTGLLGQWVKFAQASLALPRDAHGERWRACVPAIINLQAVTFALADLDRVALSEHALAMDKAEILINDNARTIQSAWPDGDLPASLLDIIADARAAL